MYTRINKSLYISNEIFDLNPKGGIARYFNNLISGFEEYEFADKNNKIVLHLTYYSIRMALIGFLSRKVLITTIHDAIYESFLEKNVKVILRKFICCLLSDHIIYVSEATKKKYENYWPILKRKKSSVIYHYPSLDECSEAENKIELEQPFIIYVGNRSGYKNGNQLVQIAKELKDYMFIFVGGEAPGAIDLADNIQFLGKVSDKKLVNLYRHALAFVTTSIDEGFNIPIIEAQSLGCPIICSNTDIHREVTNLSALLIPHENFGLELSQHLENLKEEQNRSYQVSLGYANLKHFSKEIFFRKHKEVYEN